jgi:hypothetical protein
VGFLWACGFLFELPVHLLRGMAHWWPPLWLLKGGRFADRSPQLELFFDFCPTQERRTGRGFCKAGKASCCMLLFWHRGGRYSVFVLPVGGTRRFPSRQEFQRQNLTSNTNTWTIGFKVAASDCCDVTNNLPFRNNLSKWSSVC